MRSCGNPDKDTQCGNHMRPVHCVTLSIEKGETYLAHGQDLLQQIVQTLGESGLHGGYGESVPLAANVHHRHGVYPHRGGGA